MQLTKFTDYALRVLIYATLNRDRQITIQELSEKYQVPKNHLLKVVHKLSTLGLLRSKRGRGGGLALGKNPKEVTVGYVVRQFEPTLLMANCSNPRCAIIVGCELKVSFDKALVAFLDVLDSYSIADLTKEPARLRNQFGLTAIEKPTGETK